MIMNIILYQNNNTIGVFDSVEQCNDFIKSIENLGWATGFKIAKFKSNSCLKLCEKDVTFLENDEEEISEHVKTIIEETPREKKKKAKNKQNDQHNINLLKNQKEKIMESKNKYNIYLNIYKLFKNNIKEDPAFEIPEIFINNFNIFKKLDEEDNLTWETFASEYKQVDFNGKLSNIFDISNDYDKKYNRVLRVESSDISDNISESESDSDNSTEGVLSTDSEEGIIEVFSSDGSNN